MEKFKCVECGVNDVDDEDEMCDECAEDYNDDEEQEEDEWLAIGLSGVRLFVVNALMSWQANLTSEF